LQPNDRSPAWTRWPLPLASLAVGILGAAAAWVGLHLLLGTMVAWMAPLAALDMAWMLRLAAAPAGRARAALAATATGIAIAASLWMVAATQIGRLLGLSPLESAQRLGPVLFGELVRHGTDGWDIAFLAIALPLAWRLGR
jgi:hypothetical protein